MKSFLLALSFILFFTACGTKRQYFEPESIEAKLSYDEKLRSSIIDKNLNYAKLRNNQVLDTNGVIENFKLEKGYELLKYEAGEFVIADANGNLKIIDEAGEELYTHKFSAAVLSVALEGDDLALVLADNTLILANRSLGIKMSQALTPALAQDSRVVAPYFLSSIIVYPSLDGKLNIVDKSTQKIIRSVVVSSEDFFNNIIYFEIFHDKMIAATAKKIVVVSAENTYSLDEDIKNVDFADDFIFIFAKNGNIIKTDLTLQKLVEKKFKFAIYNESEIYNKHLYVFEKTGYLIKSDLNLENVKVYRLKGAVDEKAFMKEGRFYYSNKILDLL
ncbi:hypothetical protein CQA38_01015 [Campylobacter sp. MIT 12-5580]|uniref:hypothetical protein n=1 Tax=Campylobacter sp. MIT 12-5580 TaxID=2040651 RepID=UPI0010F5B2F7|nr:hypothetical protein [Campylobacter sp. MIT 12-5580]TKX30252.1 hypothetical protein CQA38_01015 [Campylobacter sp. MIT 12-5580]